MSEPYASHRPLLQLADLDGLLAYMLLPSALRPSMGKEKRSINRNATSTCPSILTRAFVLMQLSSCSSKNCLAVSPCNLS
ncbi:hypothetical protein V6N13_052161 [Hibiscus sabdariffa]